LPCKNLLALLEPFSMNKSVSSPEGINTHLIILFTNVAVNRSPAFALIDELVDEEVAGTV